MEDNQPAMDILHLIPQRIHHEESSQLTTLIIEKEIKGAVFAIHPTKCPNLMGPQQASIKLLGKGPKRVESIGRVNRHLVWSYRTSTGAYNTWSNAKRTKICHSNPSLAQRPNKKLDAAVQVSDVLYNNIRGTSESDVAVKFDCSESHPCRNLQLQNVYLVKQTGAAAKAFCKNVKFIKIGNELRSASPEEKIKTRERRLQKPRTKIYPMRRSSTTADDLGAYPTYLDKYNTKATAINFVEAEIDRHIEVRTQPMWPQPECYTPRFMCAHILRCALTIQRPDMIQHPLYRPFGDDDKCT
ncbi:hypothetical protein Syun_002022 [Stephania yunnanensis]|uniref:Uncharacterized protein n=1 Tax=Stephania yunnanensis TaxID=152371 RepID=A0AAP0Q6U5_9MAGN